MVTIDAETSAPTLHGPLDPGTYPVTYATMRGTDGANTTYVVLRAKLKIFKKTAKKPRKPVVSFNGGGLVEPVAFFHTNKRLSAEEMEEHCLRWAQEHATDQWPAFSWLCLKGPVDVTLV